jgi:hypothetical protein
MTTVKQYWIVDLLNLLYTTTPTNSNRIELTKEEEEWNLQVQSDLRKKENENPFIRLIMSKMITTMEEDMLFFGVFQVRAWTMIQKLIAEKNEDDSHYIFVMKCRSHKKNECLRWYLFFFYFLLSSSTTMIEKTKITFVIGNNDAIACNTTTVDSKVYCSSPASKEMCSHASCGLDDYLIILMYSFLCKIVPDEKTQLKIISKDQYRDFDDIIRFFSSSADHHQRFLKSVRFITNCEKIPYLDQLFSFNPADLKLPSSLSENSNK